MFLFSDKGPRSLSNERMQQTGKFYHYRCKNGSIKLVTPQPVGVRTLADCHDPSPPPPAWGVSY